MAHAEAERLPLTAVAAQSTFDGCLASAHLPSEALARTLPPGITLPEGCPEEYACVLTLGQHYDGTAYFGGVPVPWGARYLESMFAVPFVEAAGGQALYIAGMTCDAWWAAWHGNFYYGFKKRLTPITWDGTRFAVGTGPQEPALLATLDPIGPSSPAALDWFAKAAALPVVGQRSDGPLVRSRFDWGFEQARVEAARLALEVEPGFPGCPSGDYAGRLGDVYRVRGMRWRLSWPAVS
jgi:hypothetical protein